jgi:predicted component of viral defense system (DUF524 family)
MKITKEYLTNLIKEELGTLLEKEVRTLDAIPGQTFKTHEINKTMKLIASKQNIVSKGKAKFNVGVTKNNELTDMVRVFDNKEHAINFFEKIKNIKDLKQLKNIFSKEGKDES